MVEVWVPPPPPPNPPPLEVLGLRVGERDPQEEGVRVLHRVPVGLLLVERLGERERDGEVVVVRVESRGVPVKMDRVGLRVVVGEQEGLGETLALQHWVVEMEGEGVVVGERVEVAQTVGVKLELLHTDRVGDMEGVEEWVGEGLKDTLEVKEGLSTVCDTVRVGEGVRDAVVVVQPVGVMLGVVDLVSDGNTVGVLELPGVLLACLEGEVMEEAVWVTLKEAACRVEVGLAAVAVPPPPMPPPPRAPVRVGVMVGLLEGERVVKGLRLAVLHPVGVEVKEGVRVELPQRVTLAVVQLVGVGVRHWVDVRVVITEEEEEERRDGEKAVEAVAQTLAKPERVRVGEGSGLEEAPPDPEETMVGEVEKEGAFEELDENMEEGDTVWEGDGVGVGVVHCKPTSGLQISPEAHTGVVVKAVHPGPVIRVEVGGHQVVVAEPHALVFPQVEGDSTTALLLLLPLPLTLVLASVNAEKRSQTTGEMPWQVNEWGDHLAPCKHRVAARGPE